MPTLKTVRQWSREVDAVASRFGERFGRREQRAHAGRYLRGLIARVERKNGWQLAEQLGDSAPTNLQHFIARAKWDADEVRDDLQRYCKKGAGSTAGCPSAWDIAKVERSSPAQR